MKIFYFLLILSCFCSSCQESKEEAMSRLVKDWKGKEVKFPSRSVFTIQGKDTVDFEFANADYKVITYIDSVGCASCKLQLPRWKALMAEVDSLTDTNIPFLFYFHPKDMKDLSYLIRRDNFTYPVCFDKEDELNQLNRFPSEMALQTFLLDKDNRVVALGNPVLNPRIKDLYLEVIMGTNETTQKEKATSVSVNRTVVDFGNFPQSEKQCASFMLTNTGKSLFVIQDIITSCGCTKVEYSKEPIRPGETLEVKVIYEAEEAGHFDKVVTVYCNAKNSPISLRVKGTALL